jgi:DNA-binding CsgD family transcriptional regulator
MASLGHANGASNSVNAANDKSDPANARPIIQIVSLGGRISDMNFSVSSTQSAAVFPEALTRSAEPPLACTDGVRRLLLQQASAAGEILSTLGVPAFILNDQGKVLAANSLTAALDDYVLWRACDRVSLMDKADDKLFRDAITSVNSTDWAVRSFPVRDSDGLAVMVAHLIPLRFLARNEFIRDATALVLTPLSLPPSLPVELVQSLFDLTPAEARVACSLASGETVNELASRQGLSKSTVKTHVRRILEKTGCNRQTDVVALLTAVSARRPANSTYSC